MANSQLPKQSKTEGGNSGVPGLLLVTDKSNPLLSDNIGTQKEHPTHKSAVCDLDDDYCFLMSLRPYMIHLSESQKLRVRIKIQKLLFDELYNDDNDD